MKTTIAEIYESGERFAAVAVMFPKGGHVEIEGRIRRVPITGSDDSNYWICRLCIPGNTTLDAKGEDRSTWTMYL